MPVSATEADWAPLVFDCYWKLKLLATLPTTHSSPQEVVVVVVVVAVVVVVVAGIEEEGSVAGAAVV